MLVALGDALLDGTHEELCAAFPKLQFRKVCNGSVRVTADLEC